MSPFWEWHDTGRRGTDRARLLWHQLDPKYVDVICKRYAELTKQPAILDSDGRTFQEIADERVGC